MRYDVFTRSSTSSSALAGLTRPPCSRMLLVVMALGILASSPASAPGGTVRRQQRLAPARAHQAGFWKVPALLFCGAIAHCVWCTHRICCSRPAHPSGIGRALASELADAGYEVGLAAAAAANRVGRRSRGVSLRARHVGCRRCSSARRTSATPSPASSSASR